jgi:large subunit ribosomal protein L28
VAVRFTAENHWRIFVMSRVCEVCGKGRGLGNHVETRGKAKYLGGVGTKVTGITRRQFLPNLQNVKTTADNGTVKTVKVCTQCIRSGAVRKQVKAIPFRVSHEAEPAASFSKKPVLNKTGADKTGAKKRL